MKKLFRFTALATLAAFLGFSAVESFHHHTAHQTETNCAVCQVAHRTPTLITPVVTFGTQWISTPSRIAAPFQSYVQFVFVAHGLSPPIL